MSTLILTHEQADFDAVASLWAAHRLYPAAIPVLPRRVNRNVRAFLTVYGEHFAFTETEDLARGHVARVIIVDAQATASVRGISPKTETTIIDHHSTEPDAARAGAATTLLVEQMAESLTPISPVEATLLLLGIYEDTGALTYFTTTARDARAAAHLLEAGARLDAVRDFMHHPLTAGQQVIYDQLLAAAETLTVNGQPVTVAATHGGEADEELSTLAHKLRDTLEPAALFILIELPGREPRVQLIARSTSARVDVGAVAARFGGGGHSRASAALIRRRPLAEVRAELVACLPEYVQPAATVADIMSHGVQTLPPETSIREAADRLRKYGYEGYPVVSEGRVLGLLTRRAVDRATHHHLDSQPIGTVMDSGQVTVAPADSLEHLQRLMVAHGWGQVPVVDDGRIVGVVTRTDLLKRLAAPERAAAPRRNLAEQLAAALPPERLALLRLIADTAGELNMSLFVVGGFVRDLLLGLPSQDFDLVVEGNAVALARRLADELGGRVTAHTQFGTAKWKLPGGPPDGHLDFVSARTEFYAHPSALPEVERGSIKLDLHRRDFTLNTLAVRLDREAFGDLLDFWGGERDLREGLIRVLHSLSFVDDPTRMLRAVRFEQRFGFRIEARTAELIAHALPLLHRVSGDRIRHELEAIFKEPDPARHLARLAGLNILSHIHPDLPATLGPRAEAARAEVGAQLREAVLWAAWLSPLPPESLETALARLNVNSRLAGLIRQVAALRARFAGFTPEQRLGQWHAALRDFDAAPLHIAVALCDEASRRDRLSIYLQQRHALKPVTTGHDLQALGLRPGPRYSQILGRLQEAYLDGEIANADDERALLAKLAAEQTDAVLKTASV